VPRDEPERLEGVGLGSGGGLLPALAPPAPALDQQPRREPRGCEAAGKRGQSRVCSDDPSLSPSPLHAREEPLPQEGAEVGGRGVLPPTLCFSFSFSFFFFFAAEKEVFELLHGRLDISAPPVHLREKVSPVGAREELLGRLGGFGEPAGEDEGLFGEFFFSLKFFFSKPRKRKIRVEIKSRTFFLLFTSALARSSSCLPGCARRARSAASTASPASRCNRSNSEAAVSLGSAGRAPPPLPLAAAAFAAASDARAASRRHVAAAAASPSARPHPLSSSFRAFSKLATASPILPRELSALP
jgi:hypothetical protein